MQGLSWLCSIGKTQVLSLKFSSFLWTTMDVGKAPQHIPPPRNIVLSHYTGSPLVLAKCFGYIRLVFVNPSLLDIIVFLLHILHDNCYGTQELHVKRNVKEHGFKKYVCHINDMNWYSSRLSLLLGFVKLGFELTMCEQGSKSLWTLVGQSAPFELRGILIGA